METEKASIDRLTARMKSSYSLIVILLNIRKRPTCPLGQISLVV